MDADASRENIIGIYIWCVVPLKGHHAKFQNMNLERIDWVIVGGESGPGSRPMNKEWVADIRNQCLGAKVPFFFKQWGGVRKKKAGRLLEKRTWDQMPVQLAYA